MRPIFRPSPTRWLGGGDIDPSALIPPNTFLSLLILLAAYAAYLLILYHRRVKKVVTMWCTDFYGYSEAK
jgi:hypothetical protein